MIVEPVCMCRRPAVQYSYNIDRFCLHPMSPRLNSTSELPHQCVVPPASSLQKTCSKLALRPTTNCRKVSCRDVHFQITPKIFGIAACLSKPRSSLSFAPGAAVSLLDGQTLEKSAMPARTSICVSTKSGGSASPSLTCSSRWSRKEKHSGNINNRLSRKSLDEDLPSTHSPSLLHVACDHRTRRIMSADVDADVNPKGLGPVSAPASADPDAAFRTCSGGKPSCCTRAAHFGKPLYTHVLYCCFVFNVMPKPCQREFKLHQRRHPPRCKCKNAPTSTRKSCK
mmetsp:Transcript_61851/g.165398  ORF Transcript_61851/g.165398 Transcript_61851/m.165398 type:complete len:283 (+) Transcript_61851:3401-4249(+)